MSDAQKDALWNSFIYIVMVVGFVLTIAISGWFLIFAATVAGLVGVVLMDAWVFLIMLGAESVLHTIMLWMRALNAPKSERRKHTTTTTTRTTSTTKTTSTHTTTTRAPTTTTNTQTTTTPPAPLRVDDIMCNRTKKRLC